MLGRNVLLFNNTISKIESLPFFSDIILARIYENIYLIVCSVKYAKKKKRLKETGYAFFGLYSFPSVFYKLSHAGTRS